MTSHIEATFWQIFRTLGTPNEKIWPGYAKLPGVKVNFVKQPYVSTFILPFVAILLNVLFHLTVLIFFNLLRYNRLRDKFPAASFSGRPILSEAGFDLLNSLLTYDPDKVQFIISNWHYFCVLVFSSCKPV